MFTEGWSNNITLSGINWSCHLIKVFTLSVQIG